MIFERDNYGYLQYFVLIDRKLTINPTKYLMFKRKIIIIGCNM